MRTYPAEWISTFSQGRAGFSQNKTLSNLSVCGSKTSITVDQFPFSISISEHTLLQFIKCPNIVKFMMVEMVEMFEMEMLPCQNVSVDQ